MALKTVADFPVTSYPRWKVQKIRRRMADVGRTSPDAFVSGVITANGTPVWRIAQR